MERRFISFDEDIINDVYDRFEGKYTKQQIKDVLKHMILYSRNLLRYTPNCQVKWPGIGFFYVNVNDAERRIEKISNLERIFGRLFPNKRMEKEMLEGKVPEIRKYLGREDVSVYSKKPMRRNERAFFRKLFKGKKPEEVQDMQKKEFLSD